MNNAEDGNPPESLIARYETLGEEGRTFARRLGLPDDFWTNVFDETDWAFTILCASIVESAVNELLVGGITWRFDTVEIPGSDFSDFVERLPMLGRTGRYALLRKIGVSKGHLDFIEALFIIRNAFAHRLGAVTRSLLHIVETHSDSQGLWRKLNLVFGDAGLEKFISAAKLKPELLKLAVMDSVLQICTIANVIASRSGSDEKKIR